MPQIKIMAIYKRFGDAIQKNKWMASLGLKTARNKLDAEWVDAITLENLHHAQSACEMCFLIKGDNSHSSIIDDEQIAGMSIRQLLNL